MKIWIKNIMAALLVLTAVGCGKEEAITVYKPYAMTVGYPENDLNILIAAGEKLYINDKEYGVLANGQVSLYEVPAELEYLVYAPKPTSREGHILNYTMPTSQTYAAGTVDRSVFPLYAITDNDGLNNLSLKAALGGLKLHIPAPADQQFAAVRSIKLKTNKYVLAGEIQVDCATGEVYIKGNASQTLTMKGSIDIAAGADVVFALPPMTFRDELEVTLTSTKGNAVCHIDLTGKTINSGEVVSAQLENIEWISATNYYGKANSVVVAPGAGSVTVDCAPYLTTSTLYAYENLAGSEDDRALSAKVLWNDVSTDFITNVQLSSDRKSFTAALNGQPGNAVVAIYNTADPNAEDATILWSFHLWVTEVNDHTLGTNSYGNNYTVMDRNLGALSVTPGDYRANGLLYEWGRKDPFVSGNAEFGSTHTNKVYDQTGETSQPVASGGATNGTIAWAIAHPHTFIKYSRSSSNNTARPYYWSYDWLYFGDEALWGNPEGYNNPKLSAIKKAIYDPCPEGYMVAPNDTWMIDSSKSIFDAPQADEGWISTSSNKGFLITYNGNRMWYPTAGLYNRKTGDIQDVGADGSTWKNCPAGLNGANTGYMIVKGNMTASGKNNCRGNAYSVRCVKTK